MPNATLNPHEQVLTLVLNFWQGRAVAMATELGLPDLLADDALHVDELARRTRTNVSALFRLLRALESIGIFNQASPRIFTNSATSACLRKDIPDSLWPLVAHNLFKGSAPYEGWNELRYALETDRSTSEKIYGCDFWEHLRRNPIADAAANGAMRSASVVMTPTVTAAYDWKQFPVIADIGGGIGTQLVSILDSSPSSRGILFDQPHLRLASIAHDRMEAVSGDFFEGAPPGADAYLLRWVLHDWADKEAAAILGSLRRSMKQTAHLIIIESIIQEGPGFDFGKWVDLQMLISVGGRERTKIEYDDLLSSVGFELRDVISTTSPLSLLIATPGQQGLPDRDDGKPL
jgi:O-methyltransferase domain/Dimerisation domain